MSKIVIFYDTSFPIDGTRPNLSFFEKFGPDVTVVNADELENSLYNGEINCFINLHGPYFPKNAWHAIYQFLSLGKGFVHLGGIPFRIPCYKVDNDWKTERPQTAYHQELNIHEALPVQSKPISFLEHNPDIPVLNNKEHLFTIENTYNFILHVTKTSSIKSEMGSVGPMDARIYPLLKGISKEGRYVAAPSVLIENTKGTFTGGRWVFINQIVGKSFWVEEGVKTLLELANFAQKGVTEMWLKTNYATYEPLERPQVSFQIQSFQYQEEWSLEFTVEKDDKNCFTETKIITSSNQLDKASFVLPIDIEPGLYQLTCKASAESGEVRILRQGFWGNDKNLLSTGSPISCGRDYFEKDGNPMPIVGMTYMTSDVSRYFLFLPNPSLWDRDMAQMKNAGINYIRTGIWTAWRNMMFVDGHVEENILRAIDAFIMCAKRNDLHVTFNFFSFTPELWEGKNPYLDPRSIEAQKRFITSIVSRHKDTTNVDWDLINEPSMFDPQRTFGGPRPMHDKFERKNFQEWLKKRHSSIRELQEKWNMTEQELPSFEAISPPEINEINLGVRNMITLKKGLKFLDYTLFTMEMHNTWAKELANTIKNIVPDHLVTVGQDEALGGQRPSPLFYSEAVDYTSNHTWWLLDDLLWDGIFTKTPNKPNLIQETGIMYVEKPNNQARRSEEELRNILERKYAYAFSTGGAGAVQWLWNTNYFMDNVNESNIGALRADGSEKPETNVSYDFGSFMKETRDLFKGRELEEVAVVFPYSNDFSIRKFAMLSTSKLTRVLAYEMNIPFRAFSEYQLEDLENQPPKLVIVPSPHNFSSHALQSLLRIVKDKDMTLLFTGPIHLDDYWEETDRTETILGELATQNVVREELLEVNGRHYPLAFSGDRIGDTLKGLRLDGKSVADCIHEVSYGKGAIIWCPLPVELNDRVEPIRALYDHALYKANVNMQFEWLSGDYPGIYGRKLEFEAGALYIFVSEFSRNTNVKIKDSVNNSVYDFIVEAERTVMFATDKEGSILSVYRPNEVEVTHE